MRIFVSLLVMIFSAGFVNADLFQYNNPFPSDTNAYGLNNVYEVTPEALSKEKQASEKVKKSKWWETKDNSENGLSVHEGIQNESLYQKGVRAEDSGFIMFK